MWHCVAVWIVPDGLRAHSVFILRVKQSKKTRRLDCMTLRMKARHYDPLKHQEPLMNDIVTSQNMWIFSNTTVGTSSLTEEHLAANLWKPDRSANLYLPHCLQIKLSWMYDKFIQAMFLFLPLVCITGLQLATLECKYITIRCMWISYFGVSAWMRSSSIHSIHWMIFSGS